MKRPPPPHSRALRTGRYSESGRIYHVTTRTAGRRPLFHDLLAARAVISTMKFQEQAERARTLAYVLMPDHLHWVFALGEGWALDQVMHSVKSFSAGLLTKKLGVDAPVWQNGYHDRALRKEEDLLELARYVVRNPLRAGLVTRLGDCPHWDAVWL